MITGNVLGNRYRIQDRIGGGGMALVFRAEDMQLGRQVAIKVLRNQYGGDDEFVRRFRREAQAAASLSHPNVVSIYDVGQQDGHYYIVMELIEGKTLKAYIQEQAPLPITEAARIAIEILAALSHAHANNIVHRDIKPHNILISRDGRVKVTDFGIARANATDTMTHTGGSLFGSAHYFSPEQASSLPADEKSDLYSVGVVLYEMVTGAVPFQGDNPVSVALKHVRERVTPPSRLNAEVPRELEAIILQAMAKEPDVRQASAIEMQGALRQLLTDYAAGRTHTVADDSPTMDLREVRQVRTGRRLEEEEEERQDDEAKPRRNWVWLWVVVIAMVLVGGASAIIYAFLNFIEVPVVTVPDVRNMDITEAQETLKGLGLASRVLSSEPSDLPANHVIRTRPEHNQEVKQLAVVELVISKGPEAKGLPNLAGLDIVRARTTLEQDGFVVGETVYRASREPENTVIDTRPPARTLLRPGDTVDLIVSQGPLRMPNLIGRSLKEAEAELARQGLTVGRVEHRPDPTQAADTVLATNPQPRSEITEGQAVDLVLAQKQEPVPEPTPEPLHSARVTIEVRGGAAGQTVKLDVIVVDEIQGAPRETTIISEDRTVGQVIPVEVTWSGRGYLKVLADGVPVYTIPLTPTQTD